MDQPRIGMEGEYDGLVRGEQAVEFRIAQAVRMLAFGLQFHEIDDVVHPDLQVRQMLPQDGDRGERLEGRYITGARHHDVGVRVVLVASPLPDADALRAVFYGGIHREPRRSWVFARNDEIDIVSASQAVIDR